MTILYVLLSENLSVWVILVYKEIHEEEGTSNNKEQWTTRHRKQDTTDKAEEEVDISMDNKDYKVIGQEEADKKDKTDKEETDNKEANAEKVQKEDKELKTGTSHFLLRLLSCIKYLACHFLCFFLSQDNVEEGDEEEENNTKDEEVDTKKEAGK